MQDKTEFLHSGRGSGTAVGYPTCAHRSVRPLGGVLLSPPFAHRPPPSVRRPGRAAARRSATARRPAPDPAPRRAGGARDRAPRRARRCRCPCRTRAEVSAFAALDGGWVAAGSAPDANGGRRLFLLRGDDRTSRPLARAPRPGEPAAARPGAAGGRRPARRPRLAGRGRRPLPLRARRRLDRPAAGRRPSASPSPVPGASSRSTGAVLADGSWLLAWSAFDGQDDEIVWSRRAGNAWQPVKRLYPDNSVPDITPALTATADGGALIAWSRFDGHGYAAADGPLRPRRRRTLARRARRRARPARSTPPSSAAAPPLSRRRAPRLVGPRPRRRRAASRPGRRSPRRWTAPPSPSRRPRSGCAGRPRK